MRGIEVDVANSLSYFSSFYVVKAQKIAEYVPVSPQGLSVRKYGRGEEAKPVELSTVVSLFVSVFVHIDKKDPKNPFWTTR